MGAQEYQLPFARRIPNDRSHDGMKPLRAICSETQSRCVSTLCDPAGTLEHIAERLHKDRVAHPARREIGGSVMPNPMTRNVDAPRHPNFPVFRDIIEEARQSCRTA